MKLGIMGAGATGGYFGGKVAAAGRHEVHFVARGAHLRALQESGLTVLTAPGAIEFRVSAVRATDNPDLVGPCDVVLFAVKAADLEPAAAAIAPMVGPETVIIPILNGLDAPAVLAGLYGHRALGGSSAIESTIAEPGVLLHPSPFAHITFGPLDGQLTPRLEDIRQAFADAGVAINLTADIRRALWEKLIILATFSGFTTVSMLPIGPIREQPDAWALMEAMAREIIAVARAEGVALVPDFLERAVGFFRGAPATMKSSMQRDRERGKPLEADLIQGAAVRAARRHGLAIPVTETIYGLLKVHAAGPPAH